MRRWLKVAIAGAVALVVLVGVWLFAFSPVFAVQDVSVVGVEDDVASAVLSAGAVQTGTPLALLNADEIAERVRSVPQVASVEVRRGWPNAVVLAVEPRVPVAVALTGSGLMLVDATGTAYESIAKAPPGLLSIQASDVGLVAAVQVVTSLPAELATRVTKVTATTRDDVAFTLRNGSTVKWGSSEDSAFKLQVLQALMQQKASTYDVSAPQLPTTAK